MQNRSMGDMVGHVGPRHIMEHVEGWAMKYDPLLETIFSPGEFGVDAFYHIIFPGFSLALH